ncbi:MAG: GNAT family N-acetyltransferase [Chloroflexi bacterium]|nr:MAG: GNAT family N-acetyltransferase [Chloroflexota bacterium]
MSKKVSESDVHIRPMLEADLDAVLEITNSAFRELVERTTGRRHDGPMFASGLGRYRLSLDPLGCHVAVRGNEVVGANFSVLRGRLGWFGPLAVRPGAQGLGIAQLLVQEFVRSAEARGATLMGLETIANSPQHVHLYMKLGFRPSWTGISFRREARPGKLSPGVEVDGAVPELSYAYPGYDAANDARATRDTNSGVSLGYRDGFAICHTVSTLWADPAIAYVPLIVAPDRETFDVLVRAVESVAREHGKMRVVTQVPGSSLATQDALLEHGYETGGAALRMKRGESLDYDAGPFFYCDDWH